MEKHKTWKLEWRNIKRQLAKVFVVSAITSCFAGTMHPKAEAYTGIPVFFKDEIIKADKLYGLIPESIEQKDFSGNLTRGEFCDVIGQACDNLVGDISYRGKQFFSDSNSESVNKAYRLGIVSGYPDGTFREDKLITRQEMFKMIHNLMALVDEESQMTREDAQSILLDYKDSGNIQEWAVVPTASVIAKGIVKGTDAKMLEPQSNTTYAQAIALVNRAISFYDEENQNWVYTGPMDPEPSPEPQPRPTPSPLASGDPMLNRVGYNDQKYILVFGSLSNSKYKSSAEAQKNMVSVTISVWKLNSVGQKTPGTLQVTVNKAIADRVKTIFREIYDSPEKFPIKSIGGYAWRSTGASEHALGLAIDINPNENYMIRNDGTVVSGSFWKPGENPYSIPADGDVVRIFRKYGFAWGGNAWRSSNDYMHFSYFGE